jgi:hypothetical protein
MVADRLTPLLDTTRVDQAVGALSAEVRDRIHEACRTTALQIVREMKARLSRQLSPKATGLTVAGILAEPSYVSPGYVVRTTDVLSEAEVEARKVWTPQRDPSAWRRKQSARYRQEPHVGLYLEKGTKPGKRRNYARTAARPFFYASLELEAPAHERRILEAMRAAANAVGLGG